MKYLKIYLKISIIALLFSCKKETATIAENDSTIYHKWAVNKVRATFLDLYGTMDYDSVLLGQGNYLEFRNTGILYSETVTTYNGTLLRIKPKKDTFSFAMKGVDTILLTKAGSINDTLYIKELSSTSLKTQIHSDFGLGKSNVWYEMTR